MRNKKVVRLTESQLHNIIAESVGQIINEISYKKLADAAKASSEREDTLRKIYPNYPSVERSDYYETDWITGDEEFNKDLWAKDSKYRDRQVEQPQKFRKGAFEKLSQEICGEPDFWEFVSRYAKTNGLDDKLMDMIVDFKEGERYIDNNKTKWSRTWSLPSDRR